MRQPTIAVLLLSLLILAACQDDAAKLEEHMSRHILERISAAGGFDDEPGRGIALQIDVEDVVGVSHQAKSLSQIVEDQI